jgi:intracellular septation protein
MLLLKAIWPILRDFLSTIVFVALVWVTDDIVLATAFGVGVGVIQTGWMLVRRHPIGLLQWFSVGLVLMLGTTTILTHNGLFFKLKSSVIAAVLATVLLNRKWLAPYVPAFVTQALDERTVERAARVWAGLMVAIAILNVVVAATCSNRIWAFFIFSFPAVSYTLLAAFQFRLYRTRFLAHLRNPIECARKE